jgi:hypothetical protein
MSGQITTSAMSAELVVAIIGVSMLLGAIDLCRQPGWAWKQANESKVAYLILVVLLPLIGLGMYVFRARPAVIAAASGEASTAEPGPVAPTESLVVGDAQPSVATSEGRPQPASMSTSTSAATSTSALARKAAPTLVSAGRQTPDSSPPASNGAFGFASFEEVAALNDHPSPARSETASMVVPAESLEISSTFFSSGATRTLRPTSLRTRAKHGLMAGPNPLATTTPAGWKSDPTRNHEFRYWDGTHWTENVADHGKQSRDAAGT